MAHLTNWMLHKFSGTRTSEYISRDSALVDSSRASTAVDYSVATSVRFEMPLSKMHGSNSAPSSPDRGNEVVGVARSRLNTFAKYNLWPRSKKSMELNERPMIFPSLTSQDRSPSSLSETSIPAVRNNALQRPTLANRRKISVPELRSKPSLDPSESSLDSPTIPGRPPLRHVASFACDLNQHERFSSYPANEWRRSRDEIGIAVSSKSLATILSPQSTWPLAPPPSYLCNPTRPLSPIFSPPECNTPTSMYSPASPIDNRPQVPPKSPTGTMYIPATPPPIPKDMPSALFSSSSPSERILPVTPRTPAASTIRSTSTDKTLCSPSSLQNLSPPIKLVTSPPLKSCLISDSTASILDRGRPIARKASSQKLRSPIGNSSNASACAAPIRTSSSPTATISSHMAVIAGNSVAEVPAKYATLPTGLRPLEAALSLPSSEKDALRVQACSQAERFEILQQAQVATLSKELRGLDERCEYLRTTYRSLRSGRQKMHSRMLGYLRSESITFSKERVLKQMEAVTELDKAIDDWALKSERAENRRLRVRQKLLEHVAGAIMLGGNASSSTETLSSGVYQRPVPNSLPTGLITPPRSKHGEPKLAEALIKDRKDVESIKIYADTQVLHLFSDIEQAIGRMCEAC